MTSDGREVETTAHASSPLCGWLASRVPLSELSYEHLLRKTVPVHRFSWAYNLGGLTLAAFIVQVVTGLLLLLYYQPSANGAYQSVQFISRVVPAGDLIRNLHAWAANAMLFFLFLHAGTVALAQAYRKPRELTWATGVLSLAIVMAMGFSGYLLPWNTLSVYATRVGVEIMEASTASLPGTLSGLGGFAAALLTGGGPIGQEALSRFFALHVAILPLTLLALAGAHLTMVQLHGMSLPPGRAPAVSPGSADPKAVRFFPEFLLRELALWLIFLSALSVLAVLCPYECLTPYTLSAAYDPLSPAPAGIKPEWYFLFLYYPLEMMPRDLAIGLAGVFFGGLLFTPWIMDRLPRLWGVSGRQSRFPTVVAAITIALLAAITVFGAELVRAVRGIS